MGAIVDRLDLSLAEAKLYLRVDDSDEDDMIQDLIDAAKGIADDYCNNPFTDDDTDDGAPLDIPAKVKVWCLEYIGRLYELRTSGVTTDYSKDLAQTIWGPADVAKLRNARLEPGF